MADMAGSLANPPRPSDAAQAKPTAKTMATNMWLMRTSNDPPVSRKPVGASPGGETLFASRNIARCKVSDAMKRGIPIAVAAITLHPCQVWEALRSEEHQSELQSLMRI